MPLSGIFFVSLHHQSNRKIMFRNTDPNPQLDIFTAPSMQLGSRASKKYSDPNAWHNQFYSLLTTKIDEEIFKPLFPEGKKSGRPNTSIRLLVAMSVLKEGFGCSDEDLFEKCDSDLLTRKALGLELLTDVTPSIDTYYLFRRRICEYQERTGIDLMQLCFEQLAGNQVRLLKISGKCVRMDSKLIGSNIARQSRYELAAMFQFNFHTRNGKTRYRGLLKHRMHAYSRCMWMNLRRMVIFQISTFQRSIFALFGPIREAFGSFMAISRKIFTCEADCYVSLRMTTLVRLNSKYAPF